MITGKGIRIVAMGKYLPKQLSSEELEANFKINSGWSKKYTGVEFRHHVTFESNGYMGARAAEEALNNAGMDLSKIDMIIAAGATYDYPIPNQASVIKAEMKNGDKYLFPAIDIDSTCLSFVTALDLTARILDGKSMKNILIVSSEISSKGLDHENWETTTLFGDGAAAAIVSFDEDSGSLYVKGMQQTDTEGVFHSIIEAGGNKNSFKDNPYTKEMYSFKMKGKQMLRLAKKEIPLFMNSFFSDLPINLEEVEVIIPHQASKMGMVLFDKLYSFKEGQVKESLSNYGNCIAASIPLTLYDCIKSGEIKRGDLCFLSGTSAGFSIGGVLLKY
jgi:3-oxoacyl-[acyl-carrier-protein] synthase-3